MLIGTSCRFSVRLRAVTITSSSVVSEEAPAAQTGAACIAALLDRAAATAKLSFVRVPCGTAAGADLDSMAAERAAVLRITIPFLSNFRGTRAHALSGRIMSCEGVTCQ